MSLSALFEDQCRQAETLLALLKREQDALLCREVPGAELENLAAAKAECYQLLEAAERERLALQGDQPSLQGGLKSGLQAAEAAGCLDLWQRLQGLLHQASHLNTLNGSLIQQRLDHNRKVLDVLGRLRGHALYGANGQHGRSGGGFQSRA